MSKKIKKWVLLFLLAIPFLLLFVLAFFSFPQQDDFVLSQFHRPDGFWGLQKWVYFNNTGRYTSTFIGALFSIDDFLYTNYYLHSWLLLLLHFLFNYYFISRVIKYLVGRDSNFFETASYSLIFFYVTANGFPLAVDSLFWFSSAVTYHVPVIVLLLLFGLMIDFLFKPSLLIFLVIAFCIVIINGTNEFMALFVSIGACVFGLIAIKNKVITWAQFATLCVVTGVSLSFLMLAPGINVRQDLMPTFNFFYSMASFIYFESFVFSKLAASGLFVYFCLDIAMRKSVIPIFADKFLGKQSIPLFFIALLLVKSISLLTILFFTHGSLPDRVLNNVSFVDLFLVIFFIQIVRNRIFFLNKFLLSYRFLIYILLVFSSTFNGNIFNSLISGFYHKKANNERIQSIKDAKRNEGKRAVVYSHEVYVKKYMETVRLPFRVKQIALKKPVLLWHPYENNDRTSLKCMIGFYGINTIVLDSLDIKTIIEK